MVAATDGQVRHVIGSGEAGLVDGPFETARFDDPHGMAQVGGDSLYVADAGNHAIRQVDLANQNVKTICGTGQQATSFHRGGSGTEVALNSPWDLAAANGALYIAMAGFHQIWWLDLATAEARPFAGSGREGIVDGPLAAAELAQPNGVATDGSRLYFADSETSSVRWAELNGSRMVKTIVGQDLFSFGDVDGSGDEVRLQHAQGIDLADGQLYVADTYNNKVKRVLPDARRVTTVVGSGSPGYTDGEAALAELQEPGGLSIANGKLYIADTNNHAIRVADMESWEVSTLELAF